MPVKFVWDESYSVGNPHVDEQHRRLFELASSLPETMNKLAIQRAMVALYQHFRQHFDDEEQLMREMGYPALEAHRRLHDDLITTLNEVCEGSLDSPHSARRFKKFIYDWVTDHILHHDLEYAWFARRERAQAA